MITWFVEPVRERPDFRLIVSFLWGDLHDTDSDGDSHNPASRTWTWLYLRNREAPGEVVDVTTLEGRGACMRVESEVAWVAAAVASLLAAESGAHVSAEPGGAPVEAGALERAMAGFDAAAGLERARVSVWREATLADPYPNLR